MTVIDWPQYVEVGHERAWEWLEWDVRNGLAFFWRRYGMGRYEGKLLPTVLRELGTGNGLRLFGD